jgi:hypothetical protein
MYLSDDAYSWFLLFIQRYNFVDFSWQIFIEIVLLKMLLIIIVISIITIIIIIIITLLLLLFTSIIQTSARDLLSAVLLIHF